LNSEAIRLFAERGYDRWIDHHGRGSLTQLVDAMFSTLDEATGEATESTEIA
jgi:hypothetical protein